MHTYALPPFAGIVLDDEIAVGEPVGRRVAPRQMPGLNRVPDRVGVEEGRGNREQGTEDCKCNPPFLRLRETLDELRRGSPPLSLLVELHAVSTLAYDDQTTE